MAKRKKTFFLACGKRSRRYTNMKTRTIEKDGMKFEFEFMDKVSDETVNSIIKDIVKTGLKKMKKKKTKTPEIKEILEKLDIKK